MGQKSLSAADVEKIAALVRPSRRLIVEDDFDPEPEMALDYQPRISYPINPDGSRGDAVCW